MEKEEEKQQQKCNPIETQGIGRFEGRTAVEEEEHSVLSLSEQQQSSTSSEHSKLQSQQSQFTHQQTSSAISPPLSSFVPLVKNKYIC
uniref:Candidate secreted effector n=1 Tax=Meloidogyne incognita TaxID=6306 RepID=A0A914MZ33_MELIC